MNQSQSTNYYEILEIAPDAPPHEIHRAYQRARSTYSADNPALYSMFSADEAREFMRLIEEAYSVLGNAVLRKNYDESLQKGGVFPVPSVPPVSSQPLPAPAATVSAHQSLPDFVPPETSAGELKRKDSGRQPLAPGMGRTLLSTYKIDEAFEKEITAMTEFDGNVLQRIRLYKSINMDKLSEATRVSRPYLMAVETNDYKNLPAAVYVRGFVVQMARNMGLDENKVAASYMKQFKAGGGK